MGCSDGVKEKNLGPLIPPNAEQQHPIEAAARARFEPFLQSKQDPNFNFKEVEEEIFSGQGLKK